MTLISSLERGRGRVEYAGLKESCLGVRGRGPQNEGDEQDRGGSLVCHEYEVLEQTASTTKGKETINIFLLNSFPIKFFRSDRTLNKWNFNSLRVTNFHDFVFVYSRDMVRHDFVNSDYLFL